MPAPKVYFKFTLVARMVPFSLVWMNRNLIVWSKKRVSINQFILTKKINFLKTSLRKNNVKCFGAALKPECCKLVCLSWIVVSLFYTYYILLGYFLRMYEHEFYSYIKKRLTVNCFILTWKHLNFWNYFWGLFTKTFFAIIMTMVNKLVC